MLFNTVEFFIFFIIVYAIYLLLQHKGQNLLLLLASYIFYGFWDWKFLSLILISTVIDYYCGIKISESESQKVKKSFLFLSILTNLSILGFFKYFNFFTGSLEAFLGIFGITPGFNSLNIILPVGISFYTFQSMSYTIDIYRNELKPSKNFLDFSLYVAFFPQLVAGPIERATHLLPQILNPRTVTKEKFYEGSYLIYWGLFQKVFVADNLARIVNPIFAEGSSFNTANVLLGTYAFAFQIFCDFAAYSNIARGLGKCMGFDIMVNFNLPYFSTNPVEFWKRWHISLSTWLRDYLYIPLGGNKAKTFRNVFITMLLGGLWHGAAWKFIAWGLYHATLIRGYRLTLPFIKKIKIQRNKFIDNLWFAVRAFLFFNAICIGWIFFRANSIEQACIMIAAIFSNFHAADFINLKTLYLYFALFTCPLLAIQYFQYQKKDLMFILKLPIIFRGIIYFIIYVLLVTWGVEGGKEFIYFQF